jgi:hypothetical protein
MKMWLAIGVLAAIVLVAGLLAGRLSEKEQKDRKTTPPDDRYPLW